MSQLSLIICASPRSGSYFLSDLLNRCGLPFGDEWLTPFHQGSRKWQYGVDADLPYLDYLRLLSDKERHRGRFALKVMYPQFRELRAALEAMPGSSEVTFRERFEGIFPNPRFIFLTRKDTLAQAISHLKARQTRQWVKRSGNRGQPEIEPVYSFVSIAQQLEEREKNEHAWRELFAAEQLDVFPVVFEDLREAPREHMERLFDWLGIDMPPGCLEEGGSRFSQMADSLNETWKKRFREDLARCCRPEDVPADKPVDQLVIRAVSLQASYLLPEACRFSVSVENAGDQAVDCIGAPDGKGWLRIVGSLQGPGIDEWFQQELRPAGNGWSAECLVPPPKVAGQCVLRLAVSDRILGHETVEERCGWSQSVTFLHSGPRARSRALFPDLVDLPNGWQSLPWFGHFLDDKFPWIYHADHEWLYIKPELEDGGTYHVLDANLGWVEIHPESYPRIRSLESGEFWSFIRREKGTRTFRNEEDGNLFTAETNRPEHLKGLGG